MRGASGGHDHVADAVVAVDDRIRKRLGNGGGDTLAELGHRQMARRVHAPELVPAAHLALEVAARSLERLEVGRIDVDGVDVHQVVDEVEPERAARLGVAEDGGSSSRTTVPSTNSMT